MYDPRTIFDHADSYFLASCILEGQTSQSKPQLTMPFAVYGAFALELYLKCLLTLESTIFRRDHDHVELFKKLKQNAQKSIRAEFEKLQPPGSREAQEKDKFGLFWFLDFDSCLAGGSRLFKEWRYAYEPDTDSSAWTPNIAVAVRNTILSLRPDWPTDLAR